MPIFRLSKADKKRLRDFLISRGYPRPAVARAMEPRWLEESWRSYREYLAASTDSSSDRLPSPASPDLAANLSRVLDDAGMSREAREEAERVVAARLSSANSKARPKPSGVPPPQPKVPRTRGPGKKPPKVTTSVQMDPEQVERLQVLAEREERTVSQLIRLAVRDYLDREGV